MADDLREEERSSRPKSESRNIDLSRRNEAPSEDMQEAAADAAEEDFSHHHQTRDDEPVADRVATLVDEHKRIFGRCVRNLAPFSVVDTHSATFHVSDHGAAMDVPLLDTVPYDPGPFGSPPLNPIKLGFPESKMDDTSLCGEHLIDGECAEVQKDEGNSLIALDGQHVLSNRRKEFLAPVYHSVTRIAAASVSVPGIPLPSLMTLLNKNLGIAGVVLEEDASVFVNNSYHSRLDDLSNVILLVVIADVSLVAISYAFAFKLLKLPSMFRVFTYEEGTTITPIDSMITEVAIRLDHWTQPLLVISGINQGSSCGHPMFYSGIVAIVREVLLGIVPPLSISFNWNEDESQETNFKDAVALGLSLINYAIRDL